MTTWQDIWNKEDRVNSHILEMLIKADGFDSPTGGLDLNLWLKNTENIVGKLEINDGDSIFEVGCGSGAFLYPFYLKNHKMGGVDYSNTLITLAKKIMPDADFRTCEAIDIDTDEKFDFVISHSVFFYFLSLEYAREVLINMIKKSNKKIAILDVNDKSKENIYHQERMKMMTEEEYKKKYKGLEHLFYEKSWFNDIAKEFGLKIEIYDQDIKEYEMSRFRFNAILTK